MPYRKPLERGFIYHIYNRGNNREDLFRDPAGYAYFLQLTKRYVLPIADIYAFCLLRNHFHLLIRVLRTSELRKAAAHRLQKVSPSQQLGNCFNAYAKSMNAIHGRTGCLFQRPFGRRPVTTRDYFTKLVLYIHLNPQAHGLSERFDLWPYSSYLSYLRDDSSYLKRSTVVGLFGGIDEFVHRHESGAEGEVPTDALPNP